MKTIILTVLLTTMSFSLRAQNIILIKNINVWDGISNELKNDFNVLIHDNLITSVNKNLSVPDSALIIDGKGGTLIPGLSDAHVHLSLTTPDYEIRNDHHWMYSSIRAAKSAENFLMCGITTVRDMGGPVFGLKRAIDEGLVAGPRIFPSGAMISQTSGHGDLRSANEPHPYWSDTHPMDALGLTFVVDGVTEVLKASRENLKNGATQLKVMAGGGVASDYDPLHSIQFTPDELKATVQAAKDWDTYVAVHVYNPEGIIRALNSGVKCIEHGQLINEEAMRLLKEKDAWLVPQSRWSMRPEPDLSKVSSADLNRTRKWIEVIKGANREMELASKYNINIAFGTDYFGDLGFEDRALAEFTSRIRWFTPLEVLKQASSGNAKLFNLSGKLNPYPNGKLGVIENGAYADLLIYNGDPTKNIQVIVNHQENLKFIMKNGNIYKNEL